MQEHKGKGTQEEELGIKVRSNDHPYQPADPQKNMLEPRKLTAYFIVFIESGTVTYNLELQDYTLTDGRLLFAAPNQIFTPPVKTADLKYFKLLFDENTLALLPQSFPFLVNPLNNPVIALDAAVKERVVKVFEILNQVLYADKHETDTEITLAYLNLLLSELNSAYFKNKRPAGILNANLSKFIEFKLVVETSLTERNWPMSWALTILIISPGSSRKAPGRAPVNFYPGRICRVNKRICPFPPVKALLLLPYKIHRHEICISNGRQQKHRF